MRGPTSHRVHRELDPVVAARVVNRWGRRSVEVHVTHDDVATVLVRLVRHDDLVASRATVRLPAGRSTVRLAVPRRLAAGHATVVVVVADAAGRTTTHCEPVHVPAR